MESEYIGFADTKRFRAISGFSEKDLQKKVFAHQDFKKFIYRFPGSRKLYIEILPALEFIRDHLLIREDSA